MTAQNVYHIYNNLDFWKQKIEEYEQRKKSEMEIKQKKKKKKIAV